MISDHARDVNLRRYALLEPSTPTSASILRDVGDQRNFVKALMSRRVFNTKSPGLNGVMRETAFRISQTRTQQNERFAAKVVAGESLHGRHSGTALMTIVVASEALDRPGVRRALSPVVVTATGADTVRNIDAAPRGV